MVLDRFIVVNNSYIKSSAIKEVQEPKIQVVKLDDNSITITLSDKCPETLDYTKAHKISDYRRKNTSVLLIPRVEVALEGLLLDNTNLYGISFYFEGGIY